MIKLFDINYKGWSLSKNGGGEMKKHLHKFETTMWLVVKTILYISMLAVFILVMGQESIGMRRLSRTLGITVTTFIFVGLMFLNVYG